jgi:hypothetical protein
MASSSSSPTAHAPPLLHHHSTSLIPHSDSETTEETIIKLNVEKLLANNLLLKAVFEKGVKENDFVEHFYSLLSSVSLQREGVIGMSIHAHKIIVGERERVRE